ncbi:unnamed protein product [Rotaria sordida]|uniref:Uncharacterized protein n=1 Tax=Rotaria sordida TaxID=392033 RepID=A0A814S1U7_9BILA|nr:unnamed protein product [Rotaria sordida]CAF3911958.1 unnamed protein product [Rotaria sordida]
MPKDYEFPQEVKQLMFHIINFVESEKNGPVIPLYNVDERLVKMLDISKRSVVRLKHELHQLRQKEMNEQQQQQEMKENDELGFIYQRTSKIKIPLDSQAFVAAKAKYFQALEELREANVHLYYHDETWLNLREVKRLIWTLEGKGEIKKWGGRGSRLAVSALINVKGYHIPSVDIWACTEEHNMDSTHFLSWLDSTCATLREEIDNATWHNKLTEESIIPKRSSIKGEIQKWLQDRKINCPQKFVKAQLLQLVCTNCPPKEYMSDCIAKKCAVEIIRLPKLHCSLNPI